MLQENCLAKIGLMICFGLTILVGLAIFGLFGLPLVLTVIIGETLIAIFFFVHTNWKKICLNKIELFALLIIIAFVCLAGIFHYDLPLGRDPLSYLIGAKKLTDEHSLVFEDFFSRPVHGVISLDRDLYTSQFLPLYIAYLGVFYLLGKLSLVFWANSVLLFFSLGFIYLIGKKLKDERVGLLAVLFFGTFYATLWFSKSTVSENLFLFLIWLGILLFVLGYQTKKTVYYFWGLFVLSLSPLCRGEGILLFLSYLFAIFWAMALDQQLKFEYFKKNTLVILLTLFNFALLKDYLVKTKIDYFIGQISYVAKNLAHPLSLGIILAILVIFVLIYSFRKSLSKINPAPSSGVRNPTGRISLMPLRYSGKLLDIQRRCGINLQRIAFFFLVFFLILFEFAIFYLAKKNNLSWSVYRIQYVLEIFCFYFLIIYILIIFKGLYRGIFTKLEFLITLAIIPSFIFLIEPNIALDQPWFMRRFYPTLVPYFILLSSFVLVKLNNQKKLFLWTLTLVVVNLALAYPILAHQEYKGIQKQLTALSQNFSKNDLVLFEPGWAWQKWAMSLHYFYDLKALPNCDLYRPEWFKKDFLDLIKKYPNWKEDSKELLKIKDFELKKEEEEFRKMILEFDNIYIVGKTNFYPYFDSPNLVYLKTQKLTYPVLEPTANLTSYIKNYGSKIYLPIVREEQIGTPPQKINSEDLNLYIYKVQDKNKILKQKAVLVSEGFKEIKDTNLIKLKEEDIKTYREDLKGLLP